MLLKRCKDSLFGLSEQVFERKNQGFRYKSILLKAIKLIVKRITL